ncbi:MAG: PAS domain-containing protein [Rhizomicrobium sp.]
MRANMDLDFTQPELIALRKVWEEKAKAAGGLPSRADFDARTLKPFLRHISIVERATNPAGRPSYRFRFYGSALAQRFGVQTGQFLELSIPPDRLDRWIAAYDAVLDAGGPDAVPQLFHDSPRLVSERRELLCAAVEWRPETNNDPRPAPISRPNRR